MKTMFRLLIAFAAAAVLWPAHPATQSRAAVPPSLAARVAAGDAVSVIVGLDASFVPEGYLDAGAVADQRDAISRVADDVMARAGLTGATVGHRLDVLPFFTARVTRGSLEALATMPGVKSLAIDELDRPTLASSVPIVNAPPAWAAGATGSGWNVAVVDTGVDKTHPFLGNRVNTEACYTNAGGTGTGTSTCPGGGYASTAVGSGVPCTATSDCRHGTHVAGIAAGANGAGGINGVAPAAGLVAINAFTRFDTTADCGGTVPCALSYTSDQVLALQRVAALAGAGNTGHIASVNMSLGGGQYFDQTTCDNANVSNGRKAAIDNLRSLGIAVAIAAGNNGYSTSMNAPGCISSAVSVGSITDALLFSSFTDNAPFLSLLAPGSDVVSSVPGAAYASFNGTSMATPHVAGAWAILKQVAPAASVTQVLAALQNTGVLLPDTRGGSSHTLIDIDAARLLLTTPASAVPGPPVNTVASVGGNTLAMQWAAPASGGAPTGYTLIVRTALHGPIVAALPLGNVLSFSTAAPNGVYFLSIVASNGAGSGLESRVAPVSVPAALTVPGTPGALSVSVVGTTANFTWSAPSSGGPVGEYVLIAGFTPGFSTAAVVLPLPPTQTSLSVPGIPPGVYYVRVYARNAAGNSPFSTNEVVVNIAAPLAPGAPVLNAPSVSAGVVSLSWSAGSGGAPTSYTLYASVTPGGAPVATVPLTGNSVSFAGVPPGTYYLRMTASNTVGTSGLSNQVTLVVP